MNLGNDDFTNFFQIRVPSLHHNLLKQFSLFGNDPSKNEFDLNMVVRISPIAPKFES
jgi:hypothetical protein